MTSVKELQAATAAKADRLGGGSFVFTDGCSMLDWGKIPYSIPGKGTSICVMGAANFEMLEAEALA